MAKSKPKSPPGKPGPRPTPPAQAPAAPADAAPTSAREKSAAAAATRRHPARRRPAAVGRPVDALGRADAGWAAGVGVLSALLFAWTFSGNVAFGDSPETVTGVRSLGVLHAPGYVTYVVAARIFAELVHFGSWTFRVNLFSLVCAVLAIVVVFVLARTFGANRVGAAVGSLVLATSVSFWFNAGFAKYYAFSALLIAVVALCAALWQERESTALLVVIGVLAGASVGVSWQLASIEIVAVAVMLFVGRSRPRAKAVLAAVAGAVVAIVAVCVYIVVRAHADPTMDFGYATNLARLKELLTAADFSGVRTAGGAGIGNFIGASPWYVAILARDAGLGGALLACVGIYDVANRRRADLGWFLAIFGIGNVIAVGISSGYNSIFGFFPGLVMGGPLVGAYLVLALLAALGATRVLHALKEWNPAAVVSVLATALIVLVAIVPSVIVHHEHADHRLPPLTDRYARSVLGSLPRHAVLLSGGWEYAQPLIEQQTLHGYRPDVTVVALDNLALGWSRAQLAKRLGSEAAGLPTGNGDGNNARAQWVATLLKSRPVYADAQAMFAAPTLLSYVPDGLVGRVVAGSPGPQANPRIAAAAAQLRRVEQADGVTSKRYDRFPATPYYFLYERAHVELAKAYAVAGDLDRAADQLELALRYAPAGETRIPIERARKHTADAKQTILGL